MIVTSYKNKEDEVILTRCYVCDYKTYSVNNEPEEEPFKKINQTIAPFAGGSIESRYTDGNYIDLYSCPFCGVVQTKNFHNYDEYEFHMMTSELERYRKINK